MANPFYVKSARSGPALQGLADSIRDYKDRQLIDDELQRQEQFREDVMNYDPNQNQQTSACFDFEENNPKAEAKL